ncbi:CehA/McbA family metallohydrolase [Consotaella aegiceratis]|uniref:CehA/McbA family metallohydrolase n=1 Tax=Consotaella aegiceratis TaxID=3097961 RepID=UPI002F41DEE3
MTIVFEGRLTLDAMATHQPHSFMVPAGVRTLKARFTHEPKHPGVGDIPHQLSISVYGPNGARGTRHNNADQSPIISQDWASPGYLPGPIEAGDWTVEIDVHRVLAPGSVAYRIDVEWSDEAPCSEAEPAIAAVKGNRRRGPGWYQGDLHGHTLHSDGGLSVADYLELALERGHDFVALTDHNTVSGLAELAARAGERITILGGEELTTFHGHALVLGTREWSEWRVKDGSTMSGLADKITADEKLFVIAHPKAEGHPFCTGCRWAYADVFPGPVRHVEIWNGPWHTNDLRNELAVRLFYRWLNAGYRMRATTGTDTHRRRPATDRLAVLMVRAQDNTEAEILQAIRSGHCYVTSGPRMEVSAVSESGETCSMGDLMAAGAATLACSVSRVTNGGGAFRLRLIHNALEVESWPVAGSAKVEVAFTTKDGDWFVFELRDAAGELHALTNPVFIGTEPQTWR